MPKIVIREKDNSTAGNILTSNFSVLVAGKIKPTANPGHPTADEPDGKGFDNNDVCVCNTVQDFLDHIQIYEDQEPSIAKAPEFLELEDHEGWEGHTEYGPLTEREFWTTYIDQAYIEDGAPSGDETQNGYLLKAGQKYKKATSWAANTNYHIILKGDEGNDSNPEVVSFGNKIAYNLLQLGFQVYYKKISNVSELSQPEFWSFAEDKSIYNFRYITHGLTKGTQDANNNIANVATHRGDCLALLEIDEEYYSGKPQKTAISSIINNGISGGDRYSAYFAPYVEYNLYAEPVVNNNYSNKFPAAFHYLACSSRAFRNYNEWYAVAGYTRGISNYVIRNVGCVFGDAATAKLQPRISKAGTNPNPAKAINLIVSLPQGYYLWGNRTAEALTEDGLVFSHFLNIRQLCCTLKKQLYTTCRALTYDPNSDILWLNFCGAIRPLLERMKSDQGIKDYAFEKKETELKGKMFAAVRIVPIEAVEDFEIIATLEDNLDNPEIQIDEKLLNDYDVQITD